MKFALTALLATVSSHQLLNVEPEIEQEFQSWIASHGKSYGTQEEYNLRLAIFSRKYNVVLKHNSENTDDHRLGLNHMADLTDHEYKKLLGFNKHKAHKKHHNKGLIGGGDHDFVHLRKLENVTLPDSVDWRTSGAVTPVKDQG